MIQKWHLHLCWNFLCLVFFFLEPFYLFPIFLPITRITTFLSHSPSPLFWGSISTSLCLHPCHPLSFSCCMLHLGLWSFLFVPRLSSPPQARRHCLPFPELFLYKGGPDEREGLFYPTLYQVSLPRVSSCASPHLEIFPLLPVVISAFSFLPPLVNTSRLWQ